MIETGQVGSDTPLWVSGAADWSPASSYPRLQGRFPSQSSSPVDASAVAGVQQPKKKCFLEKVKEWADEAGRKPPVKHISGPFDLPAKTSGYLDLREDRFVFVTGFPQREAFEIRYSAIKGTVIDTAKRMTLTRTLAVAILRLGLKRPDKFPKVDAKDETGGPTEERLLRKSGG